MLADSVNRAVSRRSGTDEDVYRESNREKVFKAMGKFLEFEDCGVMSAARLKELVLMARGRKPRMRRNDPNLVRGLVEREPVIKLCL